MTCVHKVRWSVKRPEDCRFRLSVSHYKDRIVAPDEYSGATVVTPSDQTQTLQTKDKLVREDITVGGITGTQTITENGEYDVVGDKSVTVDVDEHKFGYSDDLEDFSGGNILALISHCAEYINTGYYPKACAECFLKLTKDINYANYENLFAALFYDINCRIGAQMYQRSIVQVDVFTQRARGASNVFSLSAETPRIVFAKNYCSTDVSTVATKPLIIFYGYINNNFDVKSGYNFYGLKCYEFGKLVKKYVPWLDENNVPCVHELVDDEYFYNVGTGTFGYIDLEGNVHDA